MTARRPTARRLPALAVAALVLLASRAAGVETGQLVREIAVRHADAQPADPGYVLALVTTATGQFVTPADLARDTRALLDSGRFADAQAGLEPCGDGVRVVYTVRRRWRFSPPATVVGAHAASAARVREWLDLHDDSRLDDTVLAAACARVRDEYRKRYYPDVSVTGRLIPDPGSNGTARVAVTLVEGPKTKVAGFRFEGARAVPADDLREAVHQPSAWSPARLWRKKRFDAQELEDARLAVRDLYLDRGFLDVQVAPPELQRTATNRQSVVVRIDEGPAYRLGRVEVAGVTLFPTGAVAAVVAPLHPGQAAGRAALDAAAKRLRDFYGARGYVDTTVRPNVEAAASNGVANVRFAIREGVLASVRAVRIRGNTRTRDKVIRREIGLNPGDRLDEVQAEKSKRRLENLGYFETVRYFEVPVPDHDDQRDVVYEVEEKSTGNFMLGAGFSSVDNVIGFGEITQANFDIANWPWFSGGGQKARASVELGSSRQSAEVSFTEPWWLDRRLSLSTDAYFRERGYSEYDERRIGGGGALGFPLQVGRLSVGYHFEAVRLLDPDTGDFRRLDDGSLYRFTDEDDRFNNTPLRVAWSYDTRNRPFVPTRGLQATVFGELSGPALGGDNEVYTVGASVRRWFPLWFGHVLSLRARAESVDSYGSTDAVNITDRLFIGGGRTVRGFDYRDLGPKVLPADDPESRDYRPVGGQTLAMASAEYTVPLFKVLRFAAFSDVGNVWRDPFDADFGSYGASVGGGLRLDIPGFPIRVDYAVPVRFDDDYTDEERWVIWIGFE